MIYIYIYIHIHIYMYKTCWVIKVINVMTSSLLGGCDNLVAADPGPVFLDNGVPSGPSEQETPRAVGDDRRLLLWMAGLLIFFMIL